MDDNPEISDRLNVNKSTYHNKRPRERFICFIRGAKWMKINQLNGPSPIHDTSTWLSQSIQSIIHVCYWLGMQKNLPWKCFRTAFGHYDFLSTSASQQAWRMRKRYHLLFLLGVSWGPRPRPIHGWVAFLFCVKTRGVWRGDFVTLTRVFCQKKSAKSDNFSCGLGKPNQCGDS